MSRHEPQALPLGAQLQKDFPAKQAKPVLTASSTIAREGADAVIVDIKKSGHTTEVVTARKTGEKWLRKWYAKPRFAQHEAAMTAILERIAPDRVPICSALYDQSGGCVGTVIKLFNNHTQLSDFLKVKPYKAALSPEQYYYLNKFHDVDLTAFKVKPALKQKVEFLMYAGMGEAMVLSYFIEDDDRHKNNFFVLHDPETGKFDVKIIDFDRSGLALLSQHEVGLDRYMAAKPLRDAFPVTARDLVHFPNLQDWQVWYWPAIACARIKDHGFTSDEADEFAALEHHPVFRHRKHKMFVRLLITPDTAIQHDCLFHLEGDRYCSSLRRHFFQRKREILKKLTSTEGFKQWWAGGEARSCELADILCQADEDNALLASRRQSLSQAVSSTATSATSATSYYHTSVASMETAFWNISLETARSNLDAAVFQFLDLLNTVKSKPALVSSLSAIKERFYEAYKEFKLPIINNKTETLCSIESIQSLVATVHRVHENLQAYVATIPAGKKVYVEQLIASLAKSSYLLSRFDPAGDVKSYRLPVAGHKGFLLVSANVPTRSKRVEMLTNLAVELLLNVANRKELRSVYKSAKPPKVSSYFVSKSSSDKRGEVLFNEWWSLGEDAHNSVKRLDKLRQLLLEEEWTDSAFSYRFIDELFKTLLKTLMEENVVHLVTRFGREAAELYNLQGLEFESKTEMKQLLNSRFSTARNNLLARVQCAPAKDDDEWMVVETVKGF